MEYATFNGIPFASYGLLGATTLFLAYSVFSDDAVPPPKTMTEQIQSIMPTMTSPEKEPGEQSFIPAAISEYLPEAPKSEQSVIPEAVAEYLPKSEPEPMKGGKKKRTKHNKGKKLKKGTKRNRH
jgi:hypothetical protein